MDEALIKQQAEIYKVPGVDDNEPAVNPATKKRKRAENQQKKPPQEKAPRENTAIYVTNLPDGVTEGALADFFGRCGLIAESVDTNKPRVKLYYDDQGIFKGEALIGNRILISNASHLLIICSFFPPGISEIGCRPV